MAGKIVDRDLSEQLELEIDGEQIQYLGEVSHEQKVQLLSGATATLFPITWRAVWFSDDRINGNGRTPVIGMGLGLYQKSSPMGKLVLSATLWKK